MTITADVTSGAWPLTVIFTGSDAGAWDFGDGATGSGEVTRHTYVGEGEFAVELAVGDDVATATIEVVRPECPDAHAPKTWGTVTDPELTEISGVAQSWRDPDVLWIVEDARNPEELVAVDVSDQGNGGDVLGHFVLEELNFSDVEDLASGLDPVTGEPRLYAADFGNNDFDKTDFAIWTFDEPANARASGELRGTKTVLRYPGVAADSETLLVDPRTEDFYIATKDPTGRSVVYRKAAPHQAGGFTVLERVADLDFSVPPLTGRSTTGGSVSSDGTKVIVRTYDDQAWLWRIDGYRPFAEAFDTPPCEVRLAEEPQGESIAFANDGSGVITVGELGDAPIWFVPLSGD